MLQALVLILYFINPYIFAAIKSYGSGNRAKERPKSSSIGRIYSKL
jgi:hypothetical protein